MRIGIVGMGVVGGATAEVLRPHHELHGYDKFKPGYESLQTVVQRSEVMFICVPTPMRTSGEIDLTNLHTSVQEILGWYSRSSQPLPPLTIVIRSTAVSGTTDSLVQQYADLPVRWAFNPEFLTEASAVEDCKRSDRIVIGANDAETFDIVARVYREAGFSCPILHVDIKTAEMIKYASNAFLATKVTFANELRKICELFQVDWKRVAQIVGMDPRIGHSHFQVPGPDGDGGFGGKCLPKDLNALIYLAREHGYPPHFLEEVWRSNLKFRKRIDWVAPEHAPQRSP